MYKWKVTKADVNPALLQVVIVHCGVYFIPAREPNDKSHYWLLLASSYRVLNSIGKWLSQFDDHTILLQRNKVALIPKLLYKRECGRLVLLVAKIIDDLLITGEHCFTETFLTDSNNKFTLFTLSTVVYGPGQIRFSGFIITQDEDLTSSVNGDKNLDLLNPYPLPRVRRIQPKKKLNNV